LAPLAASAICPESAWEEGVMPDIEGTLVGKAKGCAGTG